LQALFDPLTRLVACVRGSLEAVEEVSQKVGELRDAEELVGSLAILSRVAGTYARWILDLAWLEVALTALITFVTTGVGSAVRTGPLDVAIRKVIVGRRVVGNEDRILVDVPLLIERADDVLGECSVRVVVGVSVVVELDVELWKRLLILVVPPQCEGLRVDTLGFGVDGNRGAVHVRPTDVG